jgi:hypothetical protein
MTATTQGYSGWKNWETWNVALWFANDEPLYRRVQLRLRRYGAFTADSVKQFVLDELPRGTPDMKDKLRGPKLIAAYNAVDWAAIAEDFNEMAPAS